MQIFISYRRTDSDIAGRIADHLLAEFGRDSVFLDVDSIPVGRDFRVVIERSIARSDCLVMVIGPGWNRASDSGEGPESSLQSETDFVRLEVQAALKWNIPIVPVLVGDVQMPTASSLPQDIAEVAYINATAVRSGRNFQHDIEELIAAVHSTSRQTPPPASAPSPAPTAVVEQNVQEPPKPDNDGSVYGSGVKVAAHLESPSEPGGICLSGSAYEQVEGKIGVGFQDIGEHEVKNIAQPVPAYRIAADTPDASLPETSLALPERPSIAVLPFDNMSDDAEQEYFSDGITEDIITDISKVSGLFVIARNSSFSYKNKAVKLTDVGRELGVRHVLEGSVRKAGNRVRITAQLIDAGSGVHLWAERYDRDLDDIFAVQDEVTHEIVKALKVRLTNDEKQRLAARPTESLDAHDLFIRGRDLAWRHTRATNLEARELLSGAVAHDGGFADAVAMLGFTYLLDFVNRWSEVPEAALETALELSRRGIDLDEMRPYPHYSLSVVSLWRREYETALAENDRCRELDPNFPHSWSQRGHIRHYMGRSEEAIADLQRAIRHDPLLPDVFLHFLAQCYFDLGDDKTAAEVLKRRITRQPETDVSRVLLAAALGHLGEYEEARRQWARALTVNPNYSLAQKRAILPYRDSAVLDRMAEGLDKAGIDSGENDGKA